MTCLISFAVIFMFNNGTVGMGDDAEDVFNQTSSGLSSKLQESLEDSNTILNITSNTNPEASDLGSRDSVASSYKAKESATSYWEDGKKMVSWIFSGDIGEMFILLISGLIGFTSFYYITKFIRNGI